MSQPNHCKAYVKCALGSTLHALLQDEFGLVTLSTMRGPASGVRFQLDLLDRMEYAYWRGKYDASIFVAPARHRARGIQPDEIGGRLLALPLAQRSSPTAH